MALRVELAGQMGLLDKNDYKFLWVTEFPQFEWSDEEERFVAMHHPFTMPMDEDLDKLESDPGSVRAKAYDIVLNGTEIGGGSVRIHQADVQSRMFKALGLTDEVANEKFGFLLDEFKYGVPPHAGLAYGLDRLVMLMARDDMLEILREYMETPGRSILISSHISTDLEGICDDIYMIDEGKILLHEETDKLLDQYGLLKVKADQYEALDKANILAHKKEEYGYSCLTNERQYYQENYPDITIEKGKIDDVIIMMKRGQQE